MRYFLYKTTCLINNKFYIGVHTEKRKSDGYIGCGVCSNGTAIALKKKGVKSALIDSVIKYGYSNFKREILVEFDTIEEALDYEKKIVTKDLIIDENCLNIRLGGYGGRVINTCKPIELINIYTGELLKFDSQSDCASFLGVKNISGKKKFLNSKYIINGFNKPISIKKDDGVCLYFHDIKAASDYTGIKVFSLNRLLNKDRKSCNGWFLSDFDFNSSFYKNAKKIRKSSPKSRRGKY